MDLETENGVLTGGSGFLQGDYVDLVSVPTERLGLPPHTGIEREIPIHDVTCSHNAAATARTTATHTAASIAQTTNTISHSRNRAHRITRCTTDSTRPCHSSLPSEASSPKFSAWK